METYRMKVNAVKFRASYQICSNATWEIDYLNEDKKPHATLSFKVFVSVISTKGNNLQLFLFITVISYHTVKHPV